LLDALVRTGARQFTRRFLLVSVFPTSLLLFLIFGLLWSGAPGQGPSIQRAINTATELYGIRVWLLILVAIVTSLVFHPLQLSLVRFLEGYWDGWAVGRTIGNVLIRRHEMRQRDLEEAAEVDDDDDEELEHKEEEALGSRRWSERAAQLLERYPASPDRIMPTTLGNVLRAAEDLAGQRYGLDAPMIWPRLYVLLPVNVLRILNDLRVQLDIAAQLCVMLLIGAATSTWLLLGDGVWLSIPLALYALAWLAYRSAIAIATEYGSMVATAIDLYRFDLLRALHIRLPRNLDEELKTNADVCQILAYEAESDEGSNLVYEHSDQRWSVRELLLRISATKRVTYKRRPSVRPTYTSEAAKPPMDRTAPNTVRLGIRSP